MDIVWGNIFKSGKAEDSVVDLLKKVPVFEGLNKRELTAIQNILHRREYSAGEVVFNQGVQASGMYIVADGTVEIVYEPTGQQLAELTEGEFFGELALLGDSIRSAKAVAKTACTLFGFFEADLFDMVERNPRLGVKVMTHLAMVTGERLKKSNEQVQALQQEVRDLIARIP